MVDSPARLSTAFAGPGEADNHIQSIAEEALKVEKVNDVIWEFDASRDYDPSPGLGLIRAPLLAVNFADDELNPVELGGLERAIAQVKYGRAVTVPVGPKSCGHQTLENCRSLAGLCAAFAESDGSKGTERYDQKPDGTRGLLSDARFAIHAVRPGLQSSPGRFA